MEFTEIYCIFAKKFLSMIIVNLDVMMAKRKMSLNELSEKIGITAPNLSILKTGKAKAIRFSTLDTICNVLDCTPNDILEYKGSSKGVQGEFKGSSRGVQGELKGS